MKRIITLTTAILALLGLSGAASAVTVGFTAGEGYTAGTPLNGQQGWVAQTQWSVQAVGDGVAQDTSGAFVRANFQPVPFINNAGDRFTIGATFTFISAFDAANTNNLADFAEPAFILNVTEQTISNPPGTMGVTLAVEDELDPPEFQLRFLNAASGSTNLGVVTDFDGSTFDLSVEYTKTDATNYTATATLGDGSSTWVIEDLDIAPGPAVADAQSLFGVMQTVTAVQRFGGVQVDEFVFDVVEPDLVGSITPVAVGNKVAVDTYQFDVSNDTLLQVATNLTGADWQEVAGSKTSGGGSHVRYVDDSGIVQPEAHYRVAEVLPLFEDDFEGPDKGWVASSSTTLTVWEQGTPNFSFDPVFITSAASGVSCWGTDLDDGYTLLTETTLTSPVFAVPAGGNFSLGWNEWRDMDSTPAPGASGFVRLIDLDAGATNLLHTSSADFNGWSPVSAPIPASALGHQVQIVFEFEDVSSSSEDWGGWYIDDVKVFAAP